MSLIVLQQFFRIKLVFFPFFVFYQIFYSFYLFRAALYRLKSELCQVRSNIELTVSLLITGLSNLSLTLSSALPYIGKR